MALHIEKREKKDRKKYKNKVAKSEHTVLVVSTGSFPI